jgi:hypothetical protein
MRGQLRLLTINVCLPRLLEAQIKRQAKLAFPNETMAYLLGVDAGTNVEVCRLWVPPDVSDSGTPDQISLLDHWRPAAEEKAEELELAVLGTFHSHPYPLTPLGKTRCHMLEDPTPSSADFLNSAELGPLIGICVIAETRSHELRSTLKIWGPQIPVVTRLSSKRR